MQTIMNGRVIARRFRCQHRAFSSSWNWNSYGAFIKSKTFVGIGLGISIGSAFTWSAIQYTGKRTVELATEATKTRLGLEAKEEWELLKRNVKESKIRDRPYKVEIERPDLYQQMAQHIATSTINSGKDMIVAVTGIFLWKKNPCTAQQAEINRTKRIWKIKGTH